MTGKKSTSQHVTDLCDRVSSLEKKLGEYEYRFEILESKVAFLEHHNRNLRRLLDDQNQYSRRVNLIVDGLKLQKISTDAQIRSLVLQEIQKLGINVSDKDIDRAHRIKRPFKDSKGTMHYPVIVRFNSWCARNLVFSARKRSNVYWSADLTERRSQILNEARALLSKPGSPANKYLKSVFANRNCSLSAYTKDGRYIAFNSIEEFHTNVDFIENSQPPYKAVWEALQNSKEINSVVNMAQIAVDDWVKQEKNVYVGCGHDELKLAKSKWYNPFSFDEHGRNTLQLFREYVTNNESLLEDLPELKGKSLGCHCRADSNGEIFCHAIISYFGSK